MLPRVQVQNAYFRQQMLHQSSLCCKDLTPSHFIVSLTSVGRARVINWKSVCAVLCCCVQYIGIYAEQRAFVDGINFCFRLKKSAA